MKTDTIPQQIDEHVRHLERTFIMLKPDSVQRGIIGEIIKRFEAKGFKLVGLKIVWVSNYWSQFTSLKERMLN